jgi:hypothetical protein
MYIKKSFQAYQTDFSSAPKTIITVHKSVPQDEIIYPARRIILSCGMDKSVLRDGSFRLARRIYLHNYLRAHLPAPFKHFKAENKVSPAISHKQACGR